MTEHCPSEKPPFLCNVSAHKMDTVGSVLSREKSINSSWFYSETPCVDVVKVQEMGPHVFPSFGTQPLHSHSQ